MSSFLKDTMTFVCFFFTLSLVAGVRATRSASRSSDWIQHNLEAKAFISQFSARAISLLSNHSENTWTYYTNITSHNEDAMHRSSVKYNEFIHESSKNASRLFDLSSLTVKNRRQIIAIIDIGFAAQPNETKRRRLGEISSAMQYIHNSAKADVNGKELPMYPDLAVIMASSRDYCYRSKVWTAYRNAAGGKKMRDLYSDFVELANDAYRVLGYEDMRHNWISAYESETFEEDILKLHNKLRPLYVQLHAYVRRKLKARYGEDKFPSSGHIPAHILGDMWAQDWSTLIEDMRPYPNLSTFDLTNEMIRQNYTVLKMVQAADNFFQSLGLKAMPPRFWEKSLFESPTDGRQVACHAEAVDFRNRRDYRIRMCATVTMADLETIYHEMGHIQYFLQYAHQPYLSRISPHTGFHEAVGDTIALSAMTPHNLYSIGLLNQPFDDPQSELNYLMLMALRRISLIPPSFLVDQWRWKVFRGEITKENYNKEWWNFKCKYQGIYPPVTRLSEDFDAGSIYHISHNVNYISYFLSFVLQFQFHKALCEAAGFDGPLHRCNIYNSTRAGTKLSEMLRHGATQTWQKSLRVLTGTNRMDAQPLLDYFEPLMEYLKNENLEDIDWQPNCPLNNN